MPLVYIHGVRHREPEKLPKVESKLREVIDKVRAKKPHIKIPANFAIRAPYWGGAGVKPQLTGLVPLDAPRTDAKGRGRDQAMGGATRGSEESKQEAFDVVREASGDDLESFLHLLEDTEAEPLTELERQQIEAFLRENADQLGVLGAARTRGPDDNRDLVWRRTLPSRIVDRIERAASRLIFDNEGARSLIRGAQANCGFFMGDAMSYVIQRSQLGAESPILKAVIGAFPKPGDPAEPLIVVTHSMGAAIAYDVMTKFRRDLRVDCWISVGSQIGQFANLGLLADQPVLARGQKIGGLRVHARRWFNFFDRLDFLNYLTEPAFEDVMDIEYTNKRGPMFSHSWYFKEQLFWDRVEELIFGTLQEAREFAQPIQRA